MPSKDRILLFLGQIVVLIIAVLLAEVWLVAAVLLFELYASQPFLAVCIFLAFCAGVFLCVRGVQMNSLAVQLTSRIVLSLVSVGAAVVAFEPIYVGAVTAATGSRDAYLFLPAGLALAALSATGIRYSFGWRVRFWVVFVVVLAAIVFGTFGFTIFNFF